MAVAFDAIGTGTLFNVTGAAITIAHTITGSNTVLLAGIAVGASPDTGFTTTATYNGVSMTSLGKIHSGAITSGYLEVFGIIAAAGTHNVVITPAGGTAASMCGSSISFTGAGQTLGAAFGTPKTANTPTSTTTPTATTTGSTSGNILAGYVTAGQNINAVTSPSTSRGLVSSGSSSSAAVSLGQATSPSTGSAVTMAYTLLVADDFAEAIVEVLAVGASPASVPQSPQPGSKNWRRRNRRVQISVPPQGSVNVIANAGLASATGAASNPGPGTGSIGGEGTIRVGAFLNPSAMGYTSLDWTSAATAWSGWTGDGTPTCSRWYMGAPPYAISSDITAQIAAGCKLLISLTPAYNPTSATDLANIELFMQQLVAAGANCDIALWSEPFYSGLTSAQYIAGVQYYGPTIRNFFPLVFNTANGAVSHNSEATYYPGDAWVDKVGTDFYASGYVAGDRLTTIAAVASGASPPKPFSIWELNGSPASTGQSQANVTTYFGYLTSFIQGQQALGLPIGDLCLFNGAPGASNMGAGTTGAGGFEGGSGNWSSGSGAFGTTNTQSHSGSSAATITSSGTGLINIISCTVANILTQGLACTSGDAINAAGWFKAAVTPRNVGVNISYYTSAGVLVSTTTGSTVTSSTSAWTKATITDTAPATAAFCRLIAVYGSATASGEVHYFDDPELRNVQGANPNNTTTIEFGWDYRIALWQALYTAFNGTPNGTPTSPGALAAAFNPTAVLVPMTIALAGLASATGAAFNPGAGVGPSPAAASATGAGFNPKVNIAAVAGLASATGAAFGPNVNITASAGLASAVGTGYNPSVNISFTAGLASGTGSALSPPPGVGPSPAAASATGAAFNTATVNLVVTPAPALAAGTASNPAVTLVLTSLGVASATGAAFNPPPGVGPKPPQAAATGTAFNPNVNVVLTGIGSASATGAAFNPGAGVGPSPSTAVATGAAFNAAASTGGNVTANAGLASATGAAFNPNVNVVFPAGLASATGAAFIPNVNLVVTPATASATGTAANPKVNVVLTSIGLASATGAAFNPGAGAGPKPTAAAATGAASNPAPAASPKPTAALATGTASGTSSAVVAGAGGASAVGTAFNVSAALPPRPPLNLGGSPVPVTIDATAAPVTYGGTASTVASTYGGGALPVTYDGSLAVVTIDGTAASLANTYGGTVGVTTYDGSLVGWTMQQIALTLAENNDETVSVAITSSGSPLNLTSATINMYLKTAAGTPDGSALVLSSGGGSPAITITNAAGGLCSVAIPKADLTAETNTFYRIDVVFSGLQNTAIYGSITWITL